MLSAIKSRMARGMMGLFPALILVLTIQAPALGGTEKGEDPMAGKTNLLFIHHSCGGALLADPGEKTDGARGSGERCIYTSHPNGGGLRTLLEEAGYTVNELSYESILGEDTDIHHWRAKFANHMDDLLKTSKQDEKLPEGQVNEIVVFKSCYPNNDFVGPGTEPGDPDAPERTIANSKASYNALLPLFQERPDVLFIALTAPPRAEPKPRGMKEKLASLFKKKPKDAMYARQFNTWLADRQDGWLARGDWPNVAVFDFYDILTEGGKSDWSRFPTKGGHDSHPSLEGNRLAAQLFVPFLDEARGRMETATP